MVCCAIARGFVASPALFDTAMFDRTVATQQADWHRSVATATAGFLLAPQPRHVLEIRITEGKKTQGIRGIKTYLFEDRDAPSRLVRLSQASIETNICRSARI